MQQVQEQQSMYSHFLVLQEHQPRHDKGISCKVGTVIQIKLTSDKRNFTEWMKNPLFLDLLIIPTM